MEKIQPKDLIAMLVLVLIATLKLTGHNGDLDTVVALILGYYFAKRSNSEDNGK